MAASSVSAIVYSLFYKSSFVSLIEQEDRRVGMRRC